MNLGGASGVKEDRSWTNRAGLFQGVQTCEEDQTMTLTDGKRAYLRRMVYEAARGLFGPNTVFAENSVPNYKKYDDLVALATPEIQREREWWDPTDPYVPPLVPFPWPSPEALHGRVEEMRQSL